MMRQMILYLLHFLVLITQESSSQKGFCRQDKPVVRFCTNDSLAGQTDVNIDTIGVPTYEVTVCECMILSVEVHGITISISYIDSKIPNNMMFKINNGSLSSVDSHKVGKTDKASLTLQTTNNYTKEGTCLSVSTGDTLKFNITCSKNRKSTTVSSTSSTLTPSETFTGQTTDTDPNTESYAEDTGRSPFIIPVVAALSGLVVLVIVILVIIFCRRRSLIKKQQSATSSPDVDKEDDDDYYMTENPMYNATDIPPKPQNSESKYQYIEHDNNGVRMSSDQYESNPDTPLQKQLPSKEEVEDEHYDYSTCLSNDKQALKTNKAGASLPSNLSAGTENMYDRTDNTLAKPFMGENEYHHLTPTGPRRMAAVDTYNTVGNVGDN